MKIKWKCNERKSEGVKEDGEKRRREGRIDGEEDGKKEGEEWEGAKEGRSERAMEDGNK